MKTISVCNATTFPCADVLDFAMATFLLTLGTRTMVRNFDSCDARFCVEQFCCVCTGYIIKQYELLLLKLDAPDWFHFMFRFWSYGYAHSYQYHR